MWEGMTLWRKWLSDGLFYRLLYFCILLAALRTELVRKSFHYYGNHEFIRVYFQRKTENFIILNYLIRRLKMT